MNAQNTNTQVAPMHSSELIQSASKLENLPVQSVARMQSLVVSLQNLEMSRTLAHHFCSTEMVPKQFRNKPEDGAVAIMWGNEIGLDALQSLQNVAVINGSPSLWGDALAALVKGSGVCEYLTSDFNEETMTSTVSTKRRGEPEETRSYSMADAKLAGLATRTTYQQHPKRMLHARARSHVLKDVYPDILKGIKVRETEEEDNTRKEKDITPSGSTLTDILKKKSEEVTNTTQSAASTAPQESEVSLQKEVEQSTESDYKQDSNARFTEYLRVINIADQKQLNAIGADIRDDNKILPEHREQLREAFMVALGQFQGA